MCTVFLCSSSLTSHSQVIKSIDSSQVLLSSKGAIVGASDSAAVQKPAVKSKPRVEREGKAVSNASRGTAAKPLGQSDVKVERSDLKADDGEAASDEGGPKKRNANGFTKQIMCVFWVCLTLAKTRGTVVLRYGCTCNIRRLLLC